MNKLGFIVLSFCIFLVFVTSAYAQKQSAKSSSIQHKQHIETKLPENNRNPQIESKSLENAPPADWMLIFTGILAGCTAGLWFSTRQLVKSAENTAKSQLRAYVGVINVKRHSDPDKIIINISNCGQTPAYGISCTAGAYYDPSIGKSFPTNSAHNQTIPTSTTIYPQRSINITITVPEDPTKLPKDLIDRAFRNQVTLYVFGQVTYKDVFGRNHYSDFCWYPLIPKTEDKEFAMYHKNNNAT